MKHTSGEIAVHRKTSHSNILVGELNGMPFEVASTQRGTRYDDPNAERITALWNAANGMTTEQAVKYLKYGEDAKELLADLLPLLKAGKLLPNTVKRAEYILTKLEENNE
jgi:hypothetical protein